MLILFIFILWVFLALIMTPSLMDKMVDNLPQGLFSVSPEKIFYVVLGGGLVVSGGVLGKFVLNADAINIEKACCVSAQGEYAPMSGDCANPSTEVQEDYPTCIDRVTKLSDCCDAIEGNFSLISYQCAIQEGEANADAAKSKQYGDCSSGEELSILSKTPVKAESPAEKPEDKVEEKEDAPKEAAKPADGEGKEGTKEDNASK